MQSPRNPRTSRTATTATTPRTLIAIPVYNEEKYVDTVLTKIQRFAEPYTDDFLVIDDGSTDQTPMRLAEHPVEVIRHGRNRGYGQAMIDSFRWAILHDFDWVITMDCDEQHEPESLPAFFEAISQSDRENGIDIISGSRYLRAQDQDEVMTRGAFKLPDDLPPADRRGINMRATRMINEDLGLELTDSFCGFKAYRVSALSDLSLDVTGYAFPLQFWVQAAARQLRISELPIRLIYNDPNRRFGAQLDNPDERWRHYLSVYQQELEKTGWEKRAGFANGHQRESMTIAL